MRFFCYGRIAIRFDILTWEYPHRIVGGLAMHVYDLSTTLARGGMDVTVITVNDQGVAEREELDGVKVLRVYPYDLPSRDIVNWAVQLNSYPGNQPRGAVSYHSCPRLVSGTCWPGIKALVSDSLDRYHSCH